MEIGWIMGIIFVFVTVIFIAIAFLLPEWVGITGKKAQEVMREQQGEHNPPLSQEKNSPLSHLNENTLSDKKQDE